MMIAIGLPSRQDAPRRLPSQTLDNTHEGDDTKFCACRQAGSLAAFRAVLAVHG